MGPSVLIRISFVLMCLHIIVFLIVCIRNTAAAIFHDGCWAIKFLFVLGLFIGSIWIPNWFFEGYMKFARIVSIGYLIMQALMMLVVAYKINDALVGNYERENS